MKVLMQQKRLFRRCWTALAGAVILSLVWFQPLRVQATAPASAAQGNGPIPAAAALAANSTVTPENRRLSVPGAAIATDWFDLYLHLVKTSDGFSPPVAARALGYAGVTLYEAVVPGFPEYQSLLGQLNGLAVLPRPAGNKSFDWPTAANAALASLARNLFANTSSDNLAAIQALEEQWNKTAMTRLDRATVERSLRYGQSVAGAIFAWSKTDGGHEGYLRNFPADYPTPAGRGQWLPTPPKFQATPLQPTWGENRPFVLASGAACPPALPLPYAEATGSAFYQEAMEVYTSGQNLTGEQRAIALFWSDDPGQTTTPAGHSISIVTQVLKQEEASLILAAEAYAKAGIALADSFIGCWHAKFAHNLLRPVTYIHEHIDSSWNTLLNTPPFPEYPSGHSVQSGAVAVVLADLFGDAYAFVDHTHDDRGLPPRSFASFAAFAEEAALSRLYGGIHYRRAIEAGLSQGECIGAQVNALQTRR